MSSSSSPSSSSSSSNKYLAKNNANSNGPGPIPPGPGPGNGSSNSSGELIWIYLSRYIMTSNSNSAPMMTTIRVVLLTLLVALVVASMTYYYRYYGDFTLLTLAAHLVSLAQTSFLLFSLFTWLYLLTTHLNLAPYLRDDRLIYSGFLLAFSAEFLLQFIVFNCSTSSSSESSSSPSTIMTNSNINSNGNSHMLINKQQSSNNVRVLFEWENVMFVVTLVALTTLFLLFVVCPSPRDDLARVYSRIVLITSLTRIYGTFSFGTVLPQSICAYCAYTSAFAGLLFAHYINYILDCIHIGNNNNNNSQSNQHPSTSSDIDMVRKTAIAPPTTTTTTITTTTQSSSSNTSSNSHRRSSLKEQRDKQQQQRKQLIQRRNKRSDGDDDDDDDDDDDEDMDDFCEQRSRFESLLEANRQQRTSSNRTAAITATFRRRTSLPTIPFKFDKNDQHHSTSTAAGVALVVREIKSRIDDLMSDATAAAAATASSTTSSGASVPPSPPTTIIPTSSHDPTSQQQTVNRLLGGLRTIRNMINRSALNQLVIVDRHSRQQQQQQQQQPLFKHSSSTSPSPQPPLQQQCQQQTSANHQPSTTKVMIANSTTSTTPHSTVNVVKKSIEIVVNRLRDDPTVSSTAANNNNSSNDNETKMMYEQEKDDRQKNEDEDDDDDDDEEGGIIMGRHHQEATEDNDEYDDDDDEEEEEDELDRRRNSYSADEGVASEDRVRRRRRHNNNNNSSSNQQQQQQQQQQPILQLSSSPSVQQAPSSRNRKSLPTQIYRRIFTSTSSTTNNAATNNTKSTTIRFDTSNSNTRQRSLSLKYAAENTTTTTTNKRNQNESNQKPIITTTTTTTTKRNNTSSSLDQQQQQQQTLSNEIDVVKKSLNYNELLAEKNHQKEQQTNVNNASKSTSSSSTTTNNIIPTMSTPSVQQQQQQQQQQQSLSSTPMSQIQNSNSILSNKTSDYESGESPTNSDCNSDTDKLQIQRQQQQLYHNTSTTTTTTTTSQSSGGVGEKQVEKQVPPPNQYHTQLSLKRLDQIKEEFAKCARNSQKYHNHDLLYNHFQQMSQQSCSASPSTTTNLTADEDDDDGDVEAEEEDDMYVGACDVEDDVVDDSYDVDDNEKSVWQHPDDLEKNADLLNCLHDWNFPIFKFGERSKKFILSQMACKIFDEIGLFKAFDIQIDKFINFFTALESGYIDLPYHNRIHAADVLHACYYLTTQAVPNCMHTNKSVSSTLMQMNENRKRTRLDPHQYALNYSLGATTSNSGGGGENGYGCLGDNFTQLEILALYCSAAMHDYEHPGRNNAFLITISSPLAILYNDKSVLENHHASASWLLLKSNENFNFLSSLDANEWKRLRFLVIENILATDLGRHFNIINEFNTKYNKSRPAGTCKEKGILSCEREKDIVYDFPNQAASINWTSEPDRLLVSQMVLKLADINAPLKREELHVQWTYRIVEEFYQQGDEELSLGLPMSPYMDRKQPQVAKLQESFINVLVGSLCDAYTFAGLLPGTLIDENEDESSEKSEESPTTPSPPSPKLKRFQSEMINNLKTNYKMWCGKMKIEEEELAKRLAASNTS